MPVLLADRSLILTASLLPGWRSAAARAFGRAVSRWLDFIGNRNIALLIGTVIAMGVADAAAQADAWRGLGELIGPPLETAGVIILITSAGGAFGLMLKHAGVGEAIRSVRGGPATST